MNSFRLIIVVDWFCEGKPQQWFVTVGAGCKHGAFCRAKELMREINEHAIICRIKNCELIYFKGIELC